MPIVASGIGSGLDINGLVSQLVASEAEPTNARLNSQEIEFGSELSAFGTLKSALSAFQLSVEKIEDVSTFQVSTATSSDKAIFTASAGETAVAGNYDIEVLQLAQAEKLKSADFASSAEIVGTGTLDITLGANTFQLTIDGTNRSLEGIRDAINSAIDNPGVTASIITVDSGTQLILSSSETGSNATIDVVATDDNALDGFDLTQLNTANLVTLQAASDAIIRVDTQTVTRDSNTFSDVITGITFNVQSANPGAVETLSVKADTNSIKDDIKSFVNNYNSLVGVMRGLSNFDQSTSVSGPLNGDSVVRGIQNSLRQALSTNVTGAVFSNLYELGITIGEKGSLIIDDTVLDERLSNDLIDVKQFFSSANGLAQTFGNAVSGYVDDDGIINSRTEGLQSRLDGIDDKRDRLDRRMEALEARLNAQFTAMDILVAQLQSTGSFLTQQLANLPSINR